MLTECYNFIYNLKNIIYRIFDAFPQIQEILLLVFFTSLVLGILKSARYKDNGS